MPRQNGKGSILEARELAGLFLLGEKLLIHSAHEQKTATEHFLRLLTLIESVPEFDQRVLRAPKGKGAEAIELRGGKRIFFKTRTGGGGRGLTGDFVALDEAMILPVATRGALMPTLSARSITGNPQLWYSGSAVDQEVHDHGLVFAQIRARGVRGDDPSLMYVEWSGSADHPDEVSDEMAGDPETWAQANPGLEIRIATEHVANERRSMDHRTFCVERLGIGDWPNPEGDEAYGIDPRLWALRLDSASFAQDPVCFAFDVRPDRSYSSIGVAGMRPDDLRHVELVQRDTGTGWVIPRLLELVDGHDNAGVVCDGASPAASLIPEAEEAGLEIEIVGPKEHGHACGFFFDAVDQAKLRHLGHPDLNAAVRGAVKRPLGDAWAWSRKSSVVDISPLVACTLALWKVETAAPRRSRRMVSV